MLRFVSVWLSGFGGSYLDGDSKVFSFDGKPGKRNRGNRTDASAGFHAAHAFGEWTVDLGRSFLKNDPGAV